MKFETSLFVQEVPSLGAVRGHIRFALRSSIPADIGVSAVCASAATTVLFERLQAQGTNIVLSLKDGGATIDVLSRTEGDGLEMRWDPVPLDPPRLDDLQRRIQQAIPLPNAEPAPPPVSSSLPDSPSSPSVSEMPESSNEESSDEDEDWQIKQLHRIP